MFIQDQINFCQIDDLLNLPNLYVQHEQTLRHDILFHNTH